MTANNANSTGLDNWTECECIIKAGKLCESLSNETSFQSWQRKKRGRRLGEKKGENNFAWIPCKYFRSKLEEIAHCSIVECHTLEEIISISGESFNYHRLTHTKPILGIQSALLRACLSAHELS